MALFMFCITLGGVMLGASILFGDADADVDGDLDLDGDVDHDGPGDVSVLPFASLRFWTFMVEAFGLTGALLTLMGVSGAAAVGIALFTGSVVGYAAFALFLHLAAEQVSGLVHLTDQEGQEARVLIRIPVSGTGKIVMQNQAGRIELMARSGDLDEIAVGDSVLVVSINNGVADVTAILPAGHTDEVEREGALERARQHARDAQSAPQ
ncbi:MAG: hypothetical protein GWP91_22240 [Rhodobacterales bacterium]|nr:hypothetical protein [Rhodobacterales bacterium]